MEPAVPPKAVPNEKLTPDSSPLPPDAVSSAFGPQPQLPWPKASPPNLPALFHSEVLPHLEAAKSFELGQGEKGLPESLKKFVAVPENLALMLMTIAHHGTPTTISRPQHHALATSILPHLRETSPVHSTVLSHLTLEAVASRDYALYGEIGRAVLQLPLDPVTTFSLAKAFATFSTHNVDQEPCLVPWIEVFKSKADSTTDCLFMERVLMRLMKGELSSYDHLVTALCCSPRENTRDLLERSIFPWLLDPSTASVRPTIPSLIAMTVGNLKISVPAASCFALALHGLTPQALFVGAPAALCGAVAVTCLEARRINEAVRAKLQYAVDFTDSREFMHYAERLYQKLCKFAGGDPRNESLIQKIEASPKFAPKIGSWRRSTAAAATGASQG